MNKKKAENEGGKERARDGSGGVALITNYFRPVAASSRSTAKDGGHDALPTAEGREPPPARGDAPEMTDDGAGGVESGASEAVPAATVVRAASVVAPSSRYAAESANDSTVQTTRPSADVLRLLSWEGRQSGVAVPATLEAQRTDEMTDGTDSQGFAHVWRVKSLTCSTSQSEHGERFNLCLRLLKEADRKSFYVQLTEDVPELAALVDVHPRYRPRVLPAAGAGAGADADDDADARARARAHADNVDRAATAATAKKRDARPVVAEAEDWEAREELESYAMDVEEQEAMLYEYESAKGAPTPVTGAASTAYAAPRRPGRGGYRGRGPRRYGDDRRDLRESVCRERPLPPSDRARWGRDRSYLREPLLLEDDLGAVLARGRHGARAASGLLRFLRERCSEAERNRFWQSTLPFIQVLVLRVDDLFDTVAVLPAGLNGEVTISRQGAASMLACAFFSLLPERVPQYSSGDFGPLDFGSLFALLDGGSPGGLKLDAKVRCLLHYFEELRLREEAGSPVSGNLCFCRHHVAFEEAASLFVRLEDPTSERVQLVPFHLSASGTIEDDGGGAIEIDFANRRLGGGVLRHGCVQEEIRFLINPECLLSLYLCADMGRREAVAIVGTERFSAYRGYGATFEFVGPFRDLTPADPATKQLLTTIVAIDAAYVAHAEPRCQYQRDLMEREVVKCFAGLSMQSRQLARTAYSGVATGNWGCGAFGGHVVLKAMLQWVAASLCAPASAAAGRDALSIKYFTFGNPDAELLVPVVRAVTRAGASAAVLWRALLEYGEVAQGPTAFTNEGLADFLQARFDGGE